MPLAALPLSVWTVATALSRSFSVIFASAACAFLASSGVISSPLIGITSPPATASATCVVVSLFILVFASLGCCTLVADSDAGVAVFSISRQ